MTRYLIDTDPGHDDAMAILYAARHLDLIGLSTVFGNQSVDKTTRNALVIRELAGLDIPIAAGANSPLVGARTSGADAHGKTGMDGADFPDPKGSVEKLHAADFIIEQSKVVPGDMTLIAIGPLTNVALALQKDPELAGRLREISIMGGSVDVGNMTPAAELNIFADPEAAQIVFSSGAAIRMVGLNVTRTVGANAVDIARLKESDRRVARAMGDLLSFYYERLRTAFNRETATMHDACAVIPFVHPDIIDYKDFHVDVELDGTLTRGMTLCDQRGLPLSSKFSEIHAPKPPNAKVAMKADSRKLIDTLIDTILEY